MEFKDYALNETTAAITRVLASQSAASLQQLRTLREAIDTLAQEVESAAGEAPDDEVQGLVHRLNSAASTAAQRIRDDARAAIDAARQELEAQRTQNAELTAWLEEVRGESEALRTELRYEAERAEALDRELAAATETAARLDAARLELDTACRQQAEARAAIENELAETTSRLDTTLVETARLGGQLETAAGDTARLNRELTTLREAFSQLEAARAQADAAAANETRARAVAESELRDAMAGLEAARTDTVRMRGERDAKAAELAAAMAELAAAQSDLHAARTQRDAIAAQLDASAARVNALERGQTRQEENIRQLEARLDVSVQAEKRLRELAALDEQEIAGARAATSALRAEVGRLTALLDASVRGADTLAATTTVTELMAALVTLLSSQFGRVALFRVKGNRLEGEHQVGFELTTDVSKLVIPLSVDSLLTRAVSSGAIESPSDADPPESLAPFGETSAATLAIPVMFQGEPLAVVYAEATSAAESEGAQAVHEPSVDFARLLVRQTVALLGRLTQELKVVAELREYATRLLQEAAQMYAADAAAGTAAEQVQRRLRDTIDCARQLYTQRAALEGPSAAPLLDEQIAAAIEADPSAPFARDLAAIAGRMDLIEQRPRSRRAAEAS